MRLISTCEYRKDIEELIKAGADALCFALKDSVFSTLHTITLEELPQIVQEVHNHDCQVRILMNRLFLQNEIAEAEKRLDGVMEAGADAVEAADPALIYYGKKQGYLNRMIYRSETMTTSANDVQWYQSLGMAGVMISPLLTQEEICTIAGTCRHCGLMIHGYLSESISHRTLVSAFAQSIGHEDLQNRRDLYLREEKREGRMPVFETDFGTMILTDYVQESFRYLKSFADAGLEDFEISGEYLPLEAVCDALKGCVRIRNGADGAAMEQAYRQKWQNLPLESGYYGQKTVR